MKWLLSIGLSILIFLSQPAISTAGLTHLSSGGQDVVWDNTYNQYWYWDLSEFVNKYWSEQVTAVEALNTSSYYGSSGWHIATLSEMEKLWENSDIDLVDTFNPSQDYGSYATYCGRYNSVYSELLHYLVSVSDLRDLGMGIKKGDLQYSSVLNDYGDTYLGVWVTTAVPIPGAIWLLGSGLIGIVGVRRKFKK